MSVSSSQQPSHEPTADQLRVVINTQTQIAKLGLDLNAVMTLVAEQAQHITNASGGIVELAEGEDMVYRAVAGTADNLLGLRLKRHNSLSGLCVTEAKTLYCEDSETDLWVDRVASRKVGLRSMVVVPLIHHGDAVGVLKVFSVLPHAFNESDIQVLGLMSELIAAAMYHGAKYGADELFKLATRDNLTGLANRAFFMDCLRQGLAKAKREGHKLGVLMVDMDGLKPINDHYGHCAGDAAIQALAKRLASEVRQADVVARLGGDEFALVLTSVENRDLALAAVQRIASKCDFPFVFENASVRVGASMGLAIYPEDGEQIDTLIEKADQLMYARKIQRKAKVIK